MHKTPFIKMIPQLTPLIEGGGRLNELKNSGRVGYLYFLIEIGNVKHPSIRHLSATAFNHANVHVIISVFNIFHWVNQCHLSIFAYALFRANCIYRPLTSVCDTFIFFVHWRHVCARQTLQITPQLYYIGTHKLIRTLEVSLTFEATWDLSDELNLTFIAIVSQ